MHLQLIWSGASNDFTTAIKSGASNASTTAIKSDAFNALQLDPVRCASNASTIH